MRDPLELIEDLRAAWFEGQNAWENDQGWQIAAANGRFLVALDELKEVIETR